MQNSKIYILIIVLVSTIISPSASNRVKYNFNPEWKVFVGDDSTAFKTDFDDSSWKNVTLPYAWNGDEAFKNDIIDLSTGIAWYRKHFKLPLNCNGMKVFIEFEGLRQAGEIFINGRFIGLHENGVMAFGYDITELINFEGKENVVAVRTDNSWDYKEKATDTWFQWNDRNFNANYGGLIKNVFLHITNQVYQTLPLYNNLKTTGQYIYAKDIDIKGKKAVVSAETEVKNESQSDVDIEYEVIIEDLDEKNIAVIDGGKVNIPNGETKILKASSVVENLNFWSWGYGYLYKVHTILKKDGEILDKVTTRTGFRKTEFKDGLIKLNDRVIQVKGYAQRTSNEWPAVGMSVSPWMSDFSNGLMLESNANLVRWMHVTPWKQDVESCDRLGLMQAMPAGDSEKDRTGRQWEQRVEVMRDAIVYLRNNPSIIFYESGNKGISEEHMQEMKDIRDLYDPHGGRAAGCREMLDSKVAEYGGEMLYVNKSDNMPVWAMEYMRDEGLRKYWDEYTFPYHKDGDGPLHKGQDASAYNRNQDSHAKAAVKRWYDYYRERPGTSKRVSSGGVNIIFTDSNTHHRGTENYRRSGEADAVRVVKDAFYAHQIMWDGWVEPEKDATHIVGHWNYADDIIKNIYVISTGEEVELFVNGKSKGIGRKEYEFLFTFDSISFEKGKLEAIAYGQMENITSRDIIETAGNPESIRLKLLKPDYGLKANGADMALVDVEVVDKDGRRCPTAFNIIDFEVDGPIDWRGGIAQGPGNYILSKSLPVECGVNRVILRTTIVAGEIKIKATSKGLKSTSVEFKTSPVLITEGLSLDIPGETLPVYLDRGPTPLSSSVKVTRKYIEIIGGTAGSNSENISLSYDGNQETRWTNDGTLDNGWVEYQLNGNSKIDEIALKLSGWRTRRYPIVVSTEDSIVYRGVTDPNLGYYYICLEKPVFTEKIKIRLYGETEFNDEYKLVEITGKLDRETENDRAVKNASTLNIVEVEFFEKY